MTAAEHLDRYQNYLDLTNLGHGGTKPALSFPVISLILSLARQMPACDAIDILQVSTDPGLFMVPAISDVDRQLISIWRTRRFSPRRAHRL